MTNKNKWLNKIQSTSLRKLVNGLFLLKLIAVLVVIELILFYGVFKHELTVLDFYNSPEKFSKKDIVAYYEKIKKDPSVLDDPWTPYLFANLLIDFEEVSSAQEVLKGWIEHHSENDYYRFLAAKSLYEAGDKIHANEYFQKLKGIIESDGSWASSMERQIELESRRIPKVIGAPRPIHLYLYLARFAAEEKQIEKALIYYGKGLQTHQEMGVILSDLAENCPKLLKEKNLIQMQKNLEESGVQAEVAQFIIHYCYRLSTTAVQGDQVPLLHIKEWMSRKEFVEVIKETKGKQRFKEVVVLLKLWLAEEKEDWELRIEQATVYSWIGEYEHSLHEYEIVRRDPQVPEEVMATINESYADNLSWANFFDQAAGVYQDILDHHTEYLDSKDQARIALKQAENFIWTHKYSQAIQSLKYLSELRPLAPKEKQILASSLGKIGEYNRGDAIFLELLARFPDDIELMLERLELLVLAERYEDGVSLAEEIRAHINVQPQHKVRAATHLWELSAHELAMQFYQDIADLIPEERGLFGEYITLLSMMEKYPHATVLLKHWIGEYPKDWEMRLNLARVYSWNRDYNSSLEVYEYLLSHPSPNTQQGNIQP